MPTRNGVLSTTTETIILAAGDTTATKKYNCDVMLSNQNNTDAVKVSIKIAGFEVLSRTLGKRFESSSSVGLTNFAIENPEEITVTASIANAINYRLTFYQLAI